MSSLPPKNWRETCVLASLETWACHTLSAKHTEHTILLSRSTDRAPSLVRSRNALNFSPGYRIKAKSDVLKRGLSYLSFGGSWAPKFHIFEKLYTFKIDPCRIEYLNSVGNKNSQLNFTLKCFLWIFFTKKALYTLGKWSWHLYLHRNHGVRVYKCRNDGVTVLQLGSLMIATTVKVNRKLTCMKNGWWCNTSCTG